MLDVFINPSVLGDNYKDVSILVGETTVNFGNVMVDDLLDMLDEVVHNVEVQIRELLNEEFNAES